MGGNLHGDTAVTLLESLTSPSLHQAVDGLNRCLPELPAEVRAERDEMVRQLMIHMTAERERALADGTPTARATWHDMATGLIDATAGLARPGHAVRRRVGM